MPKDRKSPSNDKIPSELIKYGGKLIAKIYTEICKNHMETKDMANPMEKSLIIHILIKGDSKMLQLPYTQPDTVKNNTKYTNPSS